LQPRGIQVCSTLQCQQRKQNNPKQIKVNSGYLARKQENNADPEHLNLKMEVFATNNVIHSLLLENNAT
jgi:hypothetical protein